MQEIESVTLHRLSYDSPAPKISVPWHSLLEERLRMRAQDAALFVAERMCDPAYVKAMAEVARKQSIYPSIWLSTDLASGDVGLALMYSYFDVCFPGQGFDALAQQYLSIMAMETRQSAFISPELFGGTSGVAFVLSQASQGGKRYQKTLVRLHEGLCHYSCTCEKTRDDDGLEVAQKFTLKPREIARLLPSVPAVGS